jgi:hypothetical protein
LKRFLPFLVTLAVGLFIASFFVNLSPTRFQVRKRGWHRYQEMQRLRIENQDLRDENRRLTEQLNEMRRTRTAFDAFEVPPPPPPPPAVRTAPRVVR